MLAEAQSHGEFFITQFGIVGRQIAGKITFVVRGPPADGAFEQPFANSRFGQRDSSMNFVRYWRYMSGFRLLASGGESIAQSFPRRNYNMVGPRLANSVFERANFRIPSLAPFSHIFPLTIDRSDAMVLLSNI